MTYGLSRAFADSVLDCLCNATNITAPAGFFLKLHTGDPGSAGTANAAVETTRQSCSMALSSGGLITNDANVQWVAVSMTETYAAVSFWSAVSGGTFLGSKALATPVPMTAGLTFTIRAGDADLSLGSIATT